jgi:hypothetical protein
MVLVVTKRMHDMAHMTSAERKSGTLESQSTHVMCVLVRQVAEGNVGCVLQHLFRHDTHQTIGHQPYKTRHVETDSNKHTTTCASQHAHATTPLPHTHTRLFILSSTASMNMTNAAARVHVHIINKACAVPPRSQHPPPHTHTHETTARGWSRINRRKPHSIAKNRRAQPQAPL